MEKFMRFCLIFIKKYSLLQSQMKNSSFFDIKNIISPKLLKIFLKNGL